MANKKRTDNKGRKLPEGFSQREDGRYQARWTFLGKRYCLYGWDLKQLKDDVIQRKAQQKSTMNIMEPSKITLAEWFPKWLEVYKAGKVKESTLNHTYKIYESYVKDQIGGLPIQEIRQIQIINLYNTYADRGFSINTIDNIQACIHGMLQAAVDNDLLIKNPADNAMQTIKAGIAEKREALTVEEEQRFFAFLENNYTFRVYFPVMTILFGTGLRIGELCGLTWPDIDFANNVIHVNRTLSYGFDYNVGKAIYRLQDPKTQNSKRDIPMTKKVKAAFRDYRKYALLLGRLTTNPVDGVTNFVFINRNRMPYTPAGFDDIMRNIVKAINRAETSMAESQDREPDLLRKITPHIARHTFTTRCFEAGMDMKTVSDILGHGSIQITMDVYTHVMEAKKQVDMQLLDDGAKIS